MDDAPDTGGRRGIRRLVFHFPGFEPITAADHAARFLRGAEAAAPHYGFRIASADSAALDGRAVLHLNTEGDGGSTQAEIVTFGFEDVVRSYTTRPLWRRLAGGLLSIARFVWQGALPLYLRTSWRFAIFFLFPVIVLAIGLLLGLLVALAMYAAPPHLPDWAIATVGLVVALPPVVYAARRHHMMLALDLWSFYADLLGPRTVEMQRRLDGSVETVRARLAQGGFDEVVFSGHSFGAAMAALAAADSLDRISPDAPSGPPVNLLTVGSGLLTIALLPAGGRLRAAVATLARARTPWLDVQSINDPVAFYKVRPSAVLGIADGVEVAIQVRVKTMLRPETYRRIKGDAFRLHRQFVLGVERPAPFSYHALLLSPEPFATLISREPVPPSASGR